MSTSATPAPDPGVGSGSASGAAPGSTPQDAPQGATHQAGAFDIRSFIGALIGVYGVILTVYGLIGSSASQRAKTDGVNINLWSGLAMVLVAAGFLVWARLRPVIVPDQGPEAP